MYDLSMDLLALAVDLGERQTRLRCRHQCIEGINAATRDRIERRPSALEDGRQMLERFLLPRRDVRDDVPDRPGFRDARVQHVRLRKTGVRVLERDPGLVESSQ